jgi:hypothetical protein
MAGCIACGRLIHEECPHSKEGKCCCAATKNTEKPITVINDDEPEIKERFSKTGIGVSAGRKRAAALYEINKDAPCEWRNLANCGGGKFPIVGCLTGKQANRHHGPIKDTSHNERKNIHLICPPCHNLWHDSNDPHYDESVYAELPHDPRPATLVELMGRGKS